MVGGRLEHRATRAAYLSVDSAVLAKEPRELHDANFSDAASSIAAHIRCTAATSFTCDKATGESIVRWCRRYLRTGRGTAASGTRQPLRLARSNGRRVYALLGMAGPPAPVSRRHQTDLVAELDQGARPVMRGAARFHANQARRQFGEEWQHLRSSKRLAENDLTGRINTVNLKNVLG